MVPTVIPVTAQKDIPGITVKQVNCCSGVVVVVAVVVVVF